MTSTLLQPSARVPWYKQISRWFRCCRVRSRHNRRSKWSIGGATCHGRAALPPSHSQVLPDFVTRLAAQYLESIEIANLWCVDKGAQMALSLPGLVREISALRGIDPDRLSTLAQLHLEEKLPSGSNVIRFAFMSTEFNSSSKITLDRMGLLLRRHRGATASIEAHAQPGAPPGIAQRISHSRATKVADALQHRGVANARLHIAAFATSRQLQEASSEEEHRRAEIFLNLEGVQFPSNRLPTVVASGASARFGAWALLSINRDSDIESDNDNL